MSARYDFTTQRLYVSDDLNGGVTLEIDRTQANYLLNVLHMQDGGHVLLFNGRDGEWLGEICHAHRKSCDIRLVKQTRPQPIAYNLTLIFAPLKKGRLDYMIQKAVEMGAGILRPVITNHTLNSKMNLDRLKANIVEAAEQCGILTIPKICAPIPLETMMDGWDKKIPIVYCDESAQGNDLGDVLRPLRDRDIALLIGPEGGFSPAERSQLQAKAHVVAISLGPRILRADTAAVAAMAVLQAMAGDW